MAKLEEGVQENVMDSFVVMIAGPVPPNPSSFSPTRTWLLRLL